MKSVVGLLLVQCLGAILVRKYQGVSVTGVLKCEQASLSNVLVQLWDYDSFDPNDLLESVRTDSMGKFTLSGGEYEYGSFNPFIRITHNCNAKPDCDRVNEFIVPKFAIGETYNMRIVNLDHFVHGEKEYCFANSTR